MNKLLIILLVMSSSGCGAADNKKPRGSWRVVIIEGCEYIESSTYAGEKYIHTKVTAQTQFTTRTRNKLTASRWMCPHGRTDGENLDSKP